MNKIAGHAALAKLERELTSVTNTLQMRFDIHRLSHPMDFNFETFLNDDPLYRDLLMKVRSLRELLK